MEPHRCHPEWPCYSTFQCHLVFLSDFLFICGRLIFVRFKFRAWPKINRCSWISLYLPIWTSYSFFSVESSPQRLSPRPSTSLTSPKPSSSRRSPTSADPSSMLSMSVLDPDVLNELPEDVRDEVISFCKKTNVSNDGRGNLPKPKSSETSPRVRCFQITLAMWSTKCLIVTVFFSSYSKQAFDRWECCNFEGHEFESRCQSGFLPPCSST